MNELPWPERDYVVQVARFGPAKGEKCNSSTISLLLILPLLGIPNVIDSYYKLRNLLKERAPELSALGTSKLSRMRRTKRLHWLVTHPSLMVSPVPYYWPVTRSRSCYVGDQRNIYLRHASFRLWLQ